MKCGWMPLATRRRMCSTCHDGFDGTIMSVYAAWVAGLASEVPATSAAVISSITFIWLVLIATVT